MNLINSFLFDSVVEKYGKLKKSRRCGDAYMCAGGIPEKKPEQTRLRLS